MTFSSLSILLPSLCYANVSLSMLMTSRGSRQSSGCPASLKLTKWPVSSSFARAGCDTVQSEVKHRSSPVLTLHIIWKPNKFIYICRCIVTNLNDLEVKVISPGALKSLVDQNASWKKLAKLWQRAANEEFLSQLSEWRKKVALKEEKRKHIISLHTQHQ